MRSVVSMTGHLHRPRGVVARDAAHRRRRGARRNRTATRWAARSRRPSARPPPSVSANGHGRSRWKMWPPGRPSSASSSSGVCASRHGAPSGVAQQAVLDRLGQHGVDRAQRRRDRRGCARRRGRGETAAPACAGRTRSASGPRPPAARAPRIVGSVSEWQYASQGGAARESVPAAACA